MPKEIWKLGKFHKGINSHTDPKDISSEEWVELDDVNVSKVGVAKAIGQPKTNLTVNPLEIEGSLIPGKGFYRFNSDNSFMSLDSNHSFHSLINTQNASSEGKGHAEFYIDSAVWVFDAKPTAISNMKFLLKVNGTAIMSALVCLNGSLPQDTAGTDLTGSSNVFNGTAANVTNFSSWSFLHNSNSTINALYTAIPHQIIDFSSEAGIDWHDAVNPHYNQAGLFWNPNTYDVGPNNGTNGNYGLTNLNNPNLFFSATYSSSLPSGSLDVNTHYMLGFYNWDGYANDVEDVNGIIPENVGFSGFKVPATSVAQGTGPPSPNYQKAKLSFHKALVDRINGYNSGDTADFTATFVASGNDEASDASGYIRIENSAVNGIQGAITADLTADGVTGASQIADGNVTLLDSTHRIGQGAGDGDLGTESESFHSSKYISNGISLAGETSVYGASADLNETWTLNIRGNPDSGDTINIETISQGSEITDGYISLAANYATNQAFCNAIVAAYNAATPDTGITAGSVASAASTYPNDVYTPYYIIFTSDATGVNEQFSLAVTWLDSNGVELSSRGTDDEQFGLVYKTNNTIGDAGVHGGPDLYKTGFKLYSTVGTSWYDFFNNNNLEFLTIRDADKHLDWLYTASNNNDPIFWDEGSTLRIAEANFDLLKQLDDINFQNVFQNDDGSPKDNNPSQWIGYKDLRNHFGTAYNYISRDYGFYIGKSSKIWEYTTTDDETGVLKVDNDDIDDNGNHSFNAQETGMKFYFVQGASGGLDWSNTIKIYLVSCYDDGSESLPGHSFTTNAGDFGDPEDAKTLKIQFVFKPEAANGTRLFSDARINGVRLYYTHSDESHSTFWDLGKANFDRGFIKANTIDTSDNTTGNPAKYDWIQANGTGGLHGDYGNGNLTVYNGSSNIIEYTEMPKSRTYEDINGHSPQATTLSVDYKAACIAGRRAFVGNIRVFNGSFYEYYNDRMVVSPVNALDTFPYPDNVLDLDVSDGDKIVALASYGDKVMQYKEKILYIVNISTGIASEFYVEERLKWRGIVNKNHYCYTDEGIFWVNERGAWIYDGEELKDIFIQDDADTSQQRISSTDWSDFISDETIVGYNASSREVVIAKTHTPATTADGDCYVYNLIVNSFTKGKKKFWTNANKSMTNAQSNGSLGKLSYLVEQSAGNGIGNTEIQ
tara:strand:+ start:43 stop:3567 length:3525 start_codon:yes stop_codon:yes gene_type:complete